MNYKISLQVWIQFLRILFVFSTWCTLNGQAIYQPLYTTTTFDNKPINTSFTVGSTAASADVANGAASYNIPIEIPTGTNGVIPNVSINYNSQAGHGHLGLGWGISGLSVITRSLKSIYHDGLVEPAKFLDDRFSIDGMRLISITGSYGNSGSTYGKEMEDFSLITSFGGTSLGNPEWFKVVQKDGTILEYGNTVSSRFMNEANTQTIFWRINRILYPDGNYIDFIYDNSNRDSRIDEIKYTGNIETGLVAYNTIKFQYVNRANLLDNTTYEAGNSVNLNYLLDKIVISTENSTAFKTYNFLYSNDGKNVFLSEVYEQGSDEDRLNSTIFQYGAPGPDLPNNHLLIEGTLNPSQIYTGDYDGDGVTDFAVAQLAIQDGEAIHESIKVYENNYGGGAPSLKFTKTLPYTGFVGNGGNRYNYFSGDYNGDGSDDILYSYAVRTLNPFTGEFLFVFQNSTIFSFTNDWNTSTETVIPRPSFVYSVFANDKRSVIPGDYNGDGIIDIIVILRHIDVLTDYKAFIYYGGGLPQFTEILLPIAAVYHQITNWGVKNVNSIDFDGDGKSELMITKGSTSEVFSFINSNAYTVHAAGFPTEYHLMFFGDMNGDKKSDILVRPSLNSNSQWYVAYGTGTGYIEQPFNWSNGVFPTLNENYEGTIVHVADLNGDNRSDILRGRTNLNSDYEISYSNGNGFEKVTHPWLHAEEAKVAASGDINGDGRSDVIIRNIIDGPATALEFHSQGEDLLIKRIKNGLGHVTSWNYNKLTEFGSTYTRTENTPYPVNTIKVPMHVVSNFNVQGSITTIYRYEDMKLHKGGRGMLGFKKMTKYNASQNMYEDTEYELNTLYHILMPKYTTHRQGSTILKHLTLTNTITQQNSGPFQKQLWHRISSIYDDNTFEGRYVQTINNSYDLYGNVTNSTIENNGIETTQTQNEYAAFASHAHNRIILQTVTNTRTGEPAYSKSSSYHYTIKGQVSVMQDYIGLPQMISSQYFYNTLGCVDSTSVTTAGQTPRTSRSIYDLKGRYVMMARNTVGQTSTISEYDSRWGKPKVSTGIDGLTTNFFYDSFGRVNLTTLPQNYSIAVQYLWGGTGSEIYHIKTIHPGKPNVTEYRENRDRTLRIVSEGFNGQDITSLTSYDVHGNISTSTSSYYSSETPLITTNTYDIYNRVIQSSNALNTTQLAYVYTGGNLITTNTKVIPGGNQVNTQTKDATGKIISATDYGGTLTYTYFSHGGVKNVKLAGNTLVSYTYDEYARKKSATDINTGTILYEYDGYGQLTKETNSLGHATSLTYNTLSQLLTRTGSEGITSYEYFPSGTAASVNKLKKITSFDGDTEAYTYDTYGRPVTTAKIIGSDTFASTMEYTIYDQLQKETYPSGYEVKYAYDANGYILNLKNSDNVTFFTNTGMNGYGQNTNYTFGNAKTVVKSYNFGIPTSFTANISSLFEMAYDWNYASGNLTSRTIHNQSESFTYDNLNRLLTTSHPASPITVNYSANGNILGKSDAGPDYTYDTNRIHAMNGITTPNYPDNINISAQNISYTTFLQPSLITEGGNKLVYTYGHDYNRIKSTRSLEGIVQEERYYIGSYEKQIIGSTINDIHYIGLGEGLVCMVVRQNGGNFNEYFPFVDYLGNIAQVVDNNGFAISGSRQNYDAWGRNRNTNFEYTNLSAPPVWLYRGYTGHEHHQEFRLINMNGRMYDPVLGRVLSPDNMVSMPGFSQSYNRYSYVVNNPLKYTDPDGNEPITLTALLIGAAISVATNGVGNVINHRNFFDNAGQAAFFGALSGGMSSGIGEIAILMKDNPLVKGLFQAAAHGLTGAFMSGLQQGNPMAGFYSGSLSSIVGSLTGLLGTGAVPTLIGGGLTGGIGATMASGNFWDGVQQGLITTGLNHLLHEVVGGPGDPPKKGDKSYKSGQGGSILEFTCNECGEFEFSGITPGSGASMVTDSPLEWFIGAGALKGVFGKFFGNNAAKGGSNIKYLGRMEDLKGIPKSKTILDELPNLGSAKANYYQNMSVIRRNLREGVTFKDASWFRPNSELAPTLLNPNRTVGQTFFGAERNLMQNRGLWQR